MLFRGILLASLLAIASTTGCGGCDETAFHLDASVVDANTFGRVSLAWTLTDLAGRPISCDLIGARTVALQLRNRAGAGGSPESFSCGNSPSTTRFFESGTYNVSIELKGEDGTLATVVDQPGVVIAAGLITPLAPVEFRVDTRGSFALSIATPPGTSNCDSPPAGAGITAMTFTLESAGGGCAAIKLLRTRNGMPNGTYTIDCGSPQTSTCLRNDETLTPEVPLASGLYTIHILAKVAQEVCFRNDDELRVPAVGKVLTRTLNLENVCAP